jgi:hypothetical protein
MFLKKFILWLLAVVITLAAAVYQRMTGPTYPKRSEIMVNDSIARLKLVRSLSLNQMPEIKLNINDTSVKARLFYKRFNTEEDFQVTNFVYRNTSSRDKGFYAGIPKQPPAGKVQYYFEITDSKGTKFYFEEEPIVIRFKGDVPAFVLIPHIIFIFLAMLFSTAAGLMSVVQNPSHKKFGIWTLILLLAGGFILGPLVQYYAFGELWTGVPFGWDLTDNKTLIALIFWALAVYMNRKQDKPVYTALAAFVLLLIFSIPHSLFGSELNYTSGQITQGIILIIFRNSFKIS